MVSPVWLPIFARSTPYWPPISLANEDVSVVEILQTRGWLWGAVRKESSTRVRILRRSSVRAIPCNSVSRLLYRSAIYILFILSTWAPGL